MQSAAAIQMALELDLPRAPLAIGAGYVCVACGHRTPERAGRSCPACGGWLCAAEAWDELAAVAEWLECGIGEG